jgi:quinol monooxygenase YgiN
MIFIVVRFPVRPEHADGWIELVSEFTAATRSEPGNLFFEWYRGVEDRNDYVLVEAFRDADAGTAHVTSEHFKVAMASLPRAISARPKIVNVETPASGWSEMIELEPSQEA